MANNNETTTKFKVDISELKSAMQEAKRAVAVANSEFKAVSSSMDDWTKSSDGLSAKLKQLDTTLNSQKTVLSNLESQYELTVKQMGEGSKAADDLKIQINNQQAAINKTEKEIAKYESTLREVSEAEKTAAKTGKDVSEVLDETAKSSEDAGDGFTVLKGTIAAFIGDTLGKLVDGLKEGIASLVSFSDEADNAINKLTAKTGLYTEGMEKFEGVMKNIYNANYGESFEDIADAMSEVMSQSWDWGAENIEQVTINALTLRDTFDFEVGESMRAVNMLMEEFGITSDEAFNLVARGAQVGLNKNGDLLDVINEYSVHYAQMGASAEEFFYSLNNGTVEGAFSVDKLGDAFKEFGIRVKDGSDSTIDAFRSLGLINGDYSETIKKTTKDIDSYKTKIADLEQKLKYAQIEQKGFTDKTSELTKMKTADNIAKWSSELETLKIDLNDSSNYLDRIRELSNSGKQSAGDLFDRFNAGGEEAKAATKEVLDALFAMEDKTEQNAAGVALFGTMWEDMGADAIQALMDISDDGSDSFLELYDTMNQINEVRYDSVGDAFESLKRNIQTGILMPIGDKLLPIISEVATKFEEWLNNPDTQAGIAELTDKVAEFVDNGLAAIKEGVQWFLANKDAVITGLAAIAGGFVAFKVASLIQSVTSALKGMSVAQAALNVVMNANPIMLIVTAIGALIAGFIALWNNCDSFRNFWINLWEGIKSAFNAAVQGIVTFFTETIPTVFSNVINWIKENWDTLLLFLINPFAGLFKYFYENNEKFKEFVDNAIDAIKELPTKIGEWLTNAIEVVANWGANMWAKAKEIGRNFLDGVVEFFTDLPYKIGYALGMAIAQVIQWGIDLYTFATTKIPEFITTVVNFFAELPSKIWTCLKNVVTKVAQWTTEMVAKGKDAATKFINGVIDLFKQLPSKVWTWLKNTVSKVAEWIVDMVEKAKEAGTKFVEKVIEFVKKLPTKIWDWLEETLLKVYKWGVELKDIGLRAAKTLVENIINKVKELPSKIMSIGSDIVTGLWNGISNMAGWIGEKIKGFGEGVLDGIKDFFGIHSPSKLMADEIGRWIPEGIAVGIDENAKSVLSSMRDLTAGSVAAARQGLTNGTVSGGVVSGAASVVNNFYQTNNSPKALSRLEIYRQSKNLLGFAGGA